MDTLNKVDADFLHQLDMDYKPLTSPYTWELVDYKEQHKLKTGDIVTIRPDLTISSSTLKSQYKVISYNTKNGRYGIVPVCSPFDLPMYFYREELVLIESANKEKSFLYQVGDVVSFKLSGQKDVRYGQIKELRSAATNFYKIKDLKEACLYLIEESNIEKITYTAPDCKPVKLDTITGLTITTAESWSPIKTIETTGNIEEKPLNIKIVKKQIKLNFKN